MRATPKKWMDLEIEFIKNNYKNMTYPEIGKILERSAESVGSKINLLGLEKYPDIEPGTKFGRLTVVRKTERMDNSNQAFYLCLCECGKTKEIRNHAMIRGYTVSCGCYGKENSGMTSRLMPGEVSFNDLYAKCRSGARDRDNISFLLTKEEHRDIVTKPCYYCGKPPISYSSYLMEDKITFKVGRQIKLKWALESFININTVDRVDNNVGYIKENCVPCCIECNRSKLNRNVSDFIDHAIRIAEFQKQKA